MENLQINVFLRPELEKRRKSPRVVNENVEKLTRGFVDSLSETIRKKHLKPSVAFHDWPKPVSPSTIIHNEHCGTYQHINDPRYNSDISICAIPRLELAEGAVASLLLRKHPPHHLFLLSAEPLPKHHKQPDLYRGLLAVPTCTVQRPGQTVVEPVLSRNEDGFTFMRNAAESGMLSINSFKDLNRFRVKEIVDYVRLQKDLAL